MPGRLRPAASVLLSLFCWIPSAAFADPPAARPTAERPDTAVYVLPLETVVTATRQGIPLRENPAATTVLTGAAVGRDARGFSVGDALVSVPGLRIDAPAGAERVHLSIRGQGILAESGIRGINVMLDGLPLNDPTGVAPDAYDVDWANVDRVEVLRGPSGALYGGGGSGGVINVTTADGADTGFSPRATVTGGSYGFRKTLAEAGGSSGAMRYDVSMSQAAGDGYRAHNAFWSDNLYAKLHWTPNENVDLQQILAWTDYDEENAEGLNALQVQQDPRQANPDATPFDERFKTDRFTAGMSGRVTTVSGQALRFSAYLRTTQYLEPRPRELVRDHFLSPGATAQYDVDSRIGSWPNHLSVGGDALWQGIDELRFYNPGRANQDSLLANDNIQQRGEGAFVVDRLEITPQWSAMAAGRYDYIYNKLYDHPFKENPDLTGRKSFQRGTARAGLAWTPSRELNLYGNWGQGFLPPSTEELVNNPLAYGGFNQSLVPATSQGVELGARGRLATKLSYELCGFELDTHNDFDRYRLSDREGLTFYRNAGSSRRWGVESRAEWEPCRLLSVDAAYTWSHFRYTSPDSIDGHGLPNSPDHQLALDAEVTLMPRLTLGVGTEMQSDWELDSQNSARVPGFALWNARIAYRWRAGSLSGDAVLGGRNLLGASYMAYTEPDPDGNSYQPGPKQEVFLRVSVAR